MDKHPLTPDYCESLVELAQLCASAYAPGIYGFAKGWKRVGNITLKTSFDDSLFSEILPDEKPDANFGVIAEHTDGRRVVAFRCSNPFDVSEVPKEIQSISDYGAEEALQRIYECLEIPFIGNGPLTIVGHGIGAGLAYLFAEETYNEGDEVITFGSPRVFTKERAKQFRTNTKNCPVIVINNWFDIVPCLRMYPKLYPVDARPEYVHVGTEHHDIVGSQNYLCHFIGFYIKHLKDMADAQLKAA